MDIVSHVDGSRQPALWWAPEPARRVAGGATRAQSAVPLLVALHSWSNDYRHPDGAEFARRAQALGWAVVLPNYRGPNRNPQAGASDAAVADVVDAVAFAKRMARIDDRRVYLLGASGGAHMALVMAARHPDLWAGVSAWVPITDLAAWHPQVELLEAQHARDLEQVCGGPPGASPTVDAEYRRRSSLFILSQAAGVPIDLNAGIHDGHRGAAVPVSHSLRAFNALALANGAPETGLTGEQIAWITEKEEIPAALRTTITDAAYAKPVLLRRTAGPARLTVFEGGHDILRDAAFAWLSQQRRASPR